MERKNKKFIDWNQRMDNVLTDLKKRCRCGHTKVVPKSNKFEYVLCNWCGGRLYYDDAKQKEYEKKVDKEEFKYKLNKTIEKTNKKVEPMKRKRQINTSKMKKKTFNSNNDYFKFCNSINVTIYIVEYTDKGKIRIYYGAKIGRPKKQFIDKKNNYGRRNVRDIRRNVDPWVKKKYN